MYEGKMFPSCLSEEGVAWLKVFGSSSQEAFYIQALYDYGIAGGISVGSLGYTILGTLTLVDAIWAFKNGRQGRVAFYWDCNVLNVNVSPWRTKATMAVMTRSPLTSTTWSFGASVLCIDLD
ncbi:hypothetical protein AFLA_000227 [Aspergillus flavus NRRL3357]|nr:hypothetical protein AFLA_000227 [Aspergillus flavus NRRL3357]